MEATELEQLINQIETLIAECGLTIWIHGEKRDYIVDAVSVCLNGLDIQIEADPSNKLDWKDRR
jgi:hypothetical protein